MKGNVSLRFSRGCNHRWSFRKIVTSVIDDLIMPIVAAIVGKPDFSSIYFAMGKRF
ncbi:hypothetical protein [Chryseobacterium indoltheticum]|uniref:hypothetical protein n=1 Tax=Chryseobacterium indoltheticum TaxID=254 RepID=UPI003F493743